MLRFVEVPELLLIFNIKSIENNLDAFPSMFSKLGT